MSTNSFKLNNEIKDLLEHKTVLMEEQKALSKQVQENLRMRDSLQSKISGGLLTLQDVLRDIKLAEEDRDTLRIQISNEQKEIEKTREELEEDKKFLEQLRVSIQADLDSEYSKLTDKKTNLEKSIKELDNEYNILSKKLKDLTLSIQNKENEDKILQNKIQTFDVILQQSQEKRSVLLKELERQISEKNNELSDLEKRLQEGSTVFVQQANYLLEKERELNTKEDNLRIIGSRVERQVQQFMPAFKIKL